MLSFSIEKPEFSSIQEIKEIAIELLGYIDELWFALFSNHLPAWLQLLPLFLVILFGLFFTIDKLIELKSFSSFCQWIKSFRYDQDTKRRIKRRERFAEHIASEIKAISSREEWRDHRYAELEAEVEYEKVFKRFWHFLGQPSYKSKIREKSLAKALQGSSERQILLEGEPGAGKSVALRHVAFQMALKAEHCRTPHDVVPLYINLKLLTVQTGQTINCQLIHDFVIDTINRANDRDIAEFLEKEFNEGLQQGGWFFLFDSFDEIPDVLSAPDGDKVVRDYEQAISDFLGGFNQCRGVIASRYFRGPASLPWSRFSVLRLSEQRKQELIKKADLEQKQEELLIAELANAPDAVKSLSGNPLFLGLLSEHVRAKDSFPQTVHDVFEGYINNRFQRDEHRLQQKFSLGINELRQFAVEIAFSMAFDTGIGLSPTRQELHEARQRHFPACDFDLFSSLLNALEFIKLCKTENNHPEVNKRDVSFSHRRFQEYFSTCLVLEQPERVSAETLLINGRWRDAAVVMMQTSKNGAAISNLLTYLEQLLAVLVNKTELEINEQGHFIWVEHTLHLLSLVQDGYAGKMIALPMAIKTQISSIINFAYQKGHHLDKKWALEVAGGMVDNELIQLVEDSVTGKSEVLQEAAYQQIARLPTLTEKIINFIKKSLLKKINDEEVSKRKIEIKTFLSKLPEPDELLNFFKYLSIWIKINELMLVIFFFIIVILFYDFMSGNEFIFISSYFSVILFLIISPFIYLSFRLFNRFCFENFLYFLLALLLYSTSNLKYIESTFYTEYSLCYIFMAWNFSALFFIIYTKNINTIKFIFNPLCVFLNIVKYISLNLINLKFIDFKKYFRIIFLGIFSFTLLALIVTFVSELLKYIKEYTEYFRYIVYTPMFLFFVKYTIKKIKILKLKRYANKLSIVNSSQILTKIKTLKTNDEVLSILAIILDKKFTDNNIAEQEFEIFLRECEMNQRILDKISLILERLKRENKRT